MPAFLLGAGAVIAIIYASKMHRGRVVYSDSAGKYEVKYEKSAYQKGL